MTLTIPDLSGLITKEDVNHINLGSHQINYVSWAKTSQLLKEHAPGWEFHLRQSNNDNWLFYAPDGTAFFMCYFTSPEGKSTAEFPFPVMDHRNNPLPVEKIHSRVFTDNHRRSLCACACFTFGFAHQMWTQEEVQETALKNAVTVTQPEQKKNQAPKTPARKPDIHQGFGERLDQSEKGTFIALIKAFDKEHADWSKWLIKTFHEKFFHSSKPNFEKYWSTNLLFKPQAEFLADLIDKKTQELKAMPF